MSNSTPETVLQVKIIQILRNKWAKFQTKAQKCSRDNFFLEDLVTCTGEQGISAISRSLPDNP